MTSQAHFYAALASPPAAALLTQLRWPDGVICPHCGGSDIGGHGSYWRGPDLPRYHCKTCHRTFLLTTRTPLSRSRVPLTVWLCAAWLICLADLPG
jgi:transposase-like protein